MTDWASIIGERAGRYIAVVRRGETAVLRALLRALEAHAGPVQVIWDRRGSERRKSRRSSSPERRRGDRRTPPPATWKRLGFLLANCRLFSRNR